MIEHELTFLAKFIPKEIESAKSEEVIDIYAPRHKGYSNLRIRKKGNKFEITKKTRIDNNDHSKLKEESIDITKQEFDFLKQVNGNKLHKIRHNFMYNGRLCEFDVFQGALKGLVVVEFEFDNEEEKKNFQMPEFCLVDVTQEKFIAGGLICGKAYEDVKETLEKLNYKKLEVN